MAWINCKLQLCLLYENSQWSSCDSTLTSWPTKCPLTHKKTKSTPVTEDLVSRPITPQMYQGQIKTADSAGVVHLIHRFCLVWALLCSEDCSEVVIELSKIIFLSRVLSWAGHQFATQDFGSRWGSLMKLTQLANISTPGKHPEVYYIHIYLNILCSNIMVLNKYTGSIPFPYLFPSLKKYSTIFPVGNQTRQWKIHHLQTIFPFQCRFIDRVSHCRVTGVTHHPLAAPMIEDPVSRIRPTKMARVSS